DRARAGPGIQDDPWADHEVRQDVEGPDRIRGPVPVELRDRRVVERERMLAHPELRLRRHAIASSRRSSATSTLASRFPARSNAHCFFFTACSFGASMAMYTSPTGLPGVAPDGPAMPVIPRPIFARSFSRAPRASA